MIIAIYLALFVFYLLVIIFILYSFYAFIKGAPFVPMNKNNVRSMLELVKPQPTEILMDLGSGDGRILYLASKYKCKCIGIEINPLLYYWSKLKLRRIKNIEVRRENLWKTDLKNIDILTLFFIPPKMDRLHKKILAEMKLNSRVVSYGFKFPDWHFSEKSGNIYLYKV